jgi:hypothetical protein
MNQLLNTPADLGACLTIVEFGAERSSASHDGILDASARAMVVQQADETPAELALRATRRAARLVQAGAALEAGVIVASDVVSDEVFLGRCQIARAMIRAMRGATTPRLIFVAPSTISDEGRHELFSIAGTLATQLHGTPIEVSVRFSDRRQVSGLHPVVAPAARRRALEESQVPTAEVA